MKQLDNLTNVITELYVDKKLTTKKLEEITEGIIDITRRVRFITNLSNLKALEVESGFGWKRKARKLVDENIEISLAIFEPWEPMKEWKQYCKRKDLI